MSNTTITDRTLVTDGDTTTIDTSKDAPITILDSDIRWIGNSNTTDGSISYRNQRTIDPAVPNGDGDTLSVEGFPPIPDNTSYDRNTLRIEYRDNGTIDIEVDGTVVDSHTSAFIGENHTFSFSDSNVFSKNVEVVPDSDVSYEVEYTATYGTTSANETSNTVTEEQYDTVQLDGDGTEYTLSATYPSIDSNKEFLRHEIEITCIAPDSFQEFGTYEINPRSTNSSTIAGKDWEINSGETDSRHVTSYPYDGGFTVTASANPRGSKVDSDGGELRLYARTIYADGSTDPSVGTDVSASYTGTLYPQENSNWQYLTGLEEGSNTLSHSVSGSGAVYYEVQYEWEYKVPDPLYYLRTELNGTTYNLPLVDPTDDLLDYSNFRTTVNDTTVAADLVDTSNANASPFRVSVPNKGVKAWRQE